jgi:hypothetical protein
VLPPASPRPRRLTGQPCGPRPWPGAGRRTAAGGRSLREREGMQQEGILVRGTPWGGSPCSGCGGGVVVQVVWRWTAPPAVSRD